MKKLFYILCIYLVVISACKKNINEPIDNYDYPTGANPSKFADIQHLPNIEDIDTLTLPIFGRASPNGWDIDSMPSSELLPLFGPFKPKQVGESCVAWALCNILNYQYKIIERNETYSNADKIFSTSYIYNQRTDNTQDKGMTFGEAIKILEAKGCPKFADMNDPGGLPYNTQPSFLAHGNASYYKAVRFSKMNTDIPFVQREYIKSSIRRNLPIAFSVEIDQGFMFNFDNPLIYRKWSNDVFVWKGNYTGADRKAGNHAMVICGYDDLIGAFKVLNSWGPNWGNKGYIWIDYGQFTAQLNYHIDNPGPEIYRIESARVSGNITTWPAANILSTSATCTGTVSVSIGATVLEKGICYSLDINPTTGSTLSTNYSISNGTGYGFVSANLTVLQTNKKYYARAYAKTSAGILYGNEINFTTTQSGSGTCSNFTLTHTAGSVAPVSKTVNYGVVQTNISGSNKCWITQNLGADQQATSATDASDGAAGWYWQFNRKQGFIRVGTANIPNWTITSITENSNWTSANDPCTLLIGTGWRIPTETEWANVDGSPQNWNSYNDAYSSVLKLHAGGYLINGTGSLQVRGSNGLFWSTTQNTSTFGKFLDIKSNSSTVIAGGNKSDAFTIRCIKD